MLYKLTADIVVLIHFLWILFLIFGWLLGVRYRAIRIFHIVGLGFAFMIQIFGWYCPLTYLEVWLRQQHDLSLSYVGSFIIHYIEKLVYIELSPTIILVLTTILCVFNVYIYMTRSKKNRPPSLFSEN